MKITSTDVGIFKPEPDSLDHGKFKIHYEILNQEWAILLTQISEFIKKLRIRLLSLVRQQGVHCAYETVV